PMSQMIMTRLRSQRSISAPAGRQKSAKGNPRRAVIKPVCAGEFVNARMSSGNATSETCEPTEDTAWPLISKRKSRLRHNGFVGRCFGAATTSTSRNCSSCSLSGTFDMSYTPYKEYVQRFLYG